VPVNSTGEKKTGRPPPNLHPVNSMSQAVGWNRVEHVKLTDKRAVHPPLITSNRCVLFVFLAVLQFFTALENFIPFRKLPQDRSNHIVLTSLHATRRRLPPSVLDAQRRHALVAQCVTVSEASTHVPEQAPASDVGGSSTSSSGSSSPHSRFSQFDGSTTSTRPGLLCVSHSARLRIVSWRRKCHQRC
jgi:hypothetical protein